MASLEVLGVTLILVLIISMFGFHLSNGQFFQPQISATVNMRALFIMVLLVGGHHISNLTIKNFEKEIDQLFQSFFHVRILCKVQL